MPVAKPARVTDQHSRITAARAVEFEILNLRWVGERDAVGGGDGPQRRINVREMVGGEVPEESAVDFVVADAAMQPAEKQRELHQQDRNDRKQREGKRRHRFWTLEDRD